MTAGIVAWGVYLPHWRLERSAISAELGVAAGQGRRSVASYDEDAITMAVEAARRALREPRPVEPAQLLFSTPAPVYLDKTNATTLHAALGLSPGVGAYDLVGSVRSGWAAMAQAAIAGFHVPTVAVVSDLRSGLAGSVDEIHGGDGAVALLFGPEGAVAEILGRASVTEEVLDRWRVPGESASRLWEERFGEEVYVPLARQVFSAALADAGLAPGDVDRLIVTGLHARAVRSAARRLGVPASRLADCRLDTVGNLGAAQAGFCLADALEQADPGQVLVLVSLADGADAVVLRTTASLLEAQRARHDGGVAPVAVLAAGGDAVSYATFATWRGRLLREPPRRPDPERPDAPAMWRREAWKYGFTASRCCQCGFRHLPPTQTCLKCHAVGSMEPERLADVAGTVATYTVDHLSFSLSPPVVGAVIDFDGGGRYRGEMTDVDPGALRIGTRVEMAFRCVSVAQGVHNYFWKARPMAQEANRAMEGANHGE